MALDHELPVWSLRPNWTDPVLERLAWRTDVLTSETGAEQRISTRLSPRRSLEAKFTPTEGERSFLSLSLQRLGTQEWMVPLWFDRAKLTSAAASGAGSLALDTEFREFIDGGMALLVGPDAFTCEAVRITTVGPTSLTLNGVTASAWPKGTKVLPLRRARLTDSSQMNALTSRVGSASLRFEMSGANPFDSGVESLDLYEGYPLLVSGPNWSKSIDTSLAYAAFSADYDIGRRALVDPAGRAFATQQHSWLLYGREQHYSFREFAYRLRGKARPLWLPTFNEDMVVARNAAAGASVLDIRKIGYGYVGGPAEGREHILIRGGINAPMQVTALGAALAPDEERLVLGDPLAQAVKAGTPISFIDISRLDQDHIEFVHRTDTDGVAEVSAAFRAITNTRDGSAVGALPIPTATMNSSPCGGADPCACPDGWVEEMYFDLMTPLPALPNTLDPDTVGSFWSNGENLHGTVLLRLPYGVGTVNFQFAYRMATIPNVNAVDGYGAGVDCWFVRVLSHPQSSAWVSSFPLVDPDAPLYAYRYDTSENRLTIRTWYSFARENGIGGAETANLTNYGLRSGTGPTYNISAYQSDETGANHTLLGLDYTYGPEYYYIDVAETIEIVENYWEHFHRGDLP